MGFSDLPTIQRAQEYLDISFQRARTNARNHTLADKEKSVLNREKSLALIKVTTIGDYLTSKFDQLIAKYPDFDSLSEFYVQLINLTLSYSDLKKSLGAIQWFSRRVHTMTKQFSRQIKTSSSPQDVGAHLRSYYGRVSSLLKQIDASLSYLHQARQTMRTYPRIKDEFSVALAGFPNVGKSTLLARLTEAKPDIQNYAFTTKTLNVGYRDIHAISFQLIDTPGTLAREEKMNDVELQASLAIKYCAQCIVYVFDITEQCGYTIAEQLKLFKQLKKFGKPMVAFLSKQDLLTPGDVDSFRENHFSGKVIPLVTQDSDIDTFLLRVYKDTYT